MTNLFDTEPTLLEYLILGSISQKPLTGYAIRMQFKNTALGNFSSSPGSVYPALKRMESNALVEKIKAPGSEKSAFAMTRFGSEILNKWLLKKIELEDVAKKKEWLLLRFAFMDNSISLEDQIRWLESFALHLRQYLKELNNYYESPGFNALPRNGQLAFQHGIKAYKTTVLWCTQTINHLKGIK